MAKPNDRSTLKLDYDKGTKPPTVERVTRLLERAGYKAVNVEQRRSPSGEGWHVVIVVSPTPPSRYATVALQAILGSDPMREACNLARVRALRNAPHRWRSQWNVLYLNRLV